MANRSLLVTVSAGQDATTARTQVWDARAPLRLGHGFRWVAESGPEGIRLRDPSARGAVAAVRPGLPVTLPNGLTVTVREAARLAPAFESRRSGAGPVQVFACRGEWNQGAEKIGSEYVGRAGEDELFTLSRGKDVYRLASRSDRLGLEKGGSLHRLGSGQVLELTASELTRSTLTLEGDELRWVFNTAQAVELTDALERDLGSPDPESGPFRQSMLAASAALGLFVLVSAFWPRPVPVVEPPPPQYTEIDLKKPEVVVKRAAPAPIAGSPVRQKTPVRRKAVAVQAFRGKALQSAASGLLHGGMTRLLKESDFTEGSDSSDSARKLFSSKSGALVSTTPTADSIHSKSVRVASLGGAGLGKGAGVGYGTGSHASVNGQGHSYVGMDTTGSSVDEGLTREQVGEVIHRHLSEIRYCYESSLLRTPDVEGKLLMGFRISGHGKVQGADVRESSVSDARLDDCIMRRLVTWKFPNTRGGVNVAVTYPFIFKSLGR